MHLARPSAVRYILIVAVPDRWDKKSQCGTSALLKPAQLRYARLGHMSTSKKVLKKAATRATATITGYLGKSDAFDQAISALALVEEDL